MLYWTHVGHSALIFIAEYSLRSPSTSNTQTLSHDILYMVASTCIVDGEDPISFERVNDSVPIK